MKQEILRKLEEKESKNLEKYHEAALKYRCVSNGICPECGGNLTKTNNRSWFVLQTKTVNCECGFSQTEYLD